MFFLTSSLTGDGVGFLECFTFRVVRVSFELGSSCWKVLDHCMNGRLGLDLEMTESNELLVVSMSDNPSD